MFENSNLRINGTKWLPEVRSVDHWEYIKLMSLYSEISRKSLFNRAGYRQDEIGRTEYTNVELDPDMCCECLMCACTTKLEVTGSGATAVRGKVGILAGRPHTNTEIDALADATKIEMNDYRKERKLLNKGSWLRSELLRSSARKDIVLSCRLSCVHPFFLLQLIYPLRTQLVLELTLKDDKAMIIRAEGNTNNYSLEMKQIYLRIRYCTFDSRIRERWISAMSQAKITRNIQIAKHAFYTLNTGTTTARFPGLFASSVNPVCLIAFFTSQDQQNGNYRTNKFSYKDIGLKSYSIFADGSPVYQVKPMAQKKMLDW